MILQRFDAHTIEIDGNKIETTSSVHLVQQRLHAIKRNSSIETFFRLKRVRINC